ncbi:MAG: translation initiation factor IF-3 [Candidatus Mariimomonas ferrooxydans]
MGKEGEQLGIVPLQNALRMAAEQELDLVEVAHTANPPVCKIMDYGKYRYQLNKKHSTKHKTISLKEIKVRPQIGKGDLDLKIKNVIKFLKEGNKTKVTMIFRGREIVHSSIAREVFNKITAELAETANIEQMAKLEGRHMTMILSPKS